jgi:DNA polymerase-1
VKKVVHIIDGSGYIFRAYYAIRALATVGGEPTNAVYGFTTMIEKALREEQPEYIAITFDTGSPTFRRELFADYKANRGPPPEDLPRQIPRIHQIVDAFSIRRLMVGGFEADDVIATLTKRALDEGFEVELITGDKDLMQLVSDRVRIFEPMRGGRFGPQEVVEKFGVAPEKLADAMALCGDTSDNIPGVPGVGMKTAAKLINDHGDLDGVLSAAKAGKIKGKVGQALAESEEAARLSRKLVSLDHQVPLDLKLEDLHYTGPDRAKLRALFVELEFRRLIPQAEAAIPVSGEARDEDAALEPQEEAEAEGEERSAPLTRPRPQVGAKLDLDKYTIAHTADDLRALVRELESAQRIGMAIEASSARIADAELIGLAFVTDRQKGTYVPIAHRYLGCPPQIPLSDVLGMLRPVLENPSIAKVSPESKLLVEAFERYGIALAGLAFDSSIASFLLEPDETSHGPTMVARRFLGHEPLDRAQLMLREKEKLTVDALSIESCAKLACERAEIGWRAIEAMKDELELTEVMHVLKDVELPLVPVIARMELAGVRIDVAQLDKMSIKFAEELEKLEKVCYEAAGAKFNIGSPKQLQKLLFEDLKLKIIKRTKTGPSTDASVLEILASDHALPQAILDYRQVQKLKSTYADALPKMVSPKTQRVHTSFSQTGAATGRLSSTDPNLQNIPIRSELGRQLRKVFIADPGNALISVDYSQIELRVLAHFSEEPVLIAAFAENADVHARTASVLFEIDPKEVNREQRTQAKAVNFGVLYGMGAARLARDLKLPRRTASKFIEDYFVRQPNVKRYVDETLDFARNNGFVRTLLGRRRMISDINSSNRGMRAAAERVAVNTPIQGSSADLIKLAMIRLDARLREEHLPAKLILQVHDELLLEAKIDRAAEIAAVVKREMENVFPLKVPLLAEAKWGPSWDEAH